MKKGISLLLSAFGLFVFLDFAYAISLPSSQTGPSYNPGPSSTTTTPAPDSRVVPPIGLTKHPATIQRPGVTLPTQYVIDQRYDVDLPECPPFPVCPDINGKMPAGVTKNCPQTCTVNRIVSVANPLDPNSKIIYVYLPQCPKDYSAVASYKMGKEIVLTTQKEAATFPIDSLATYNGYVAAGYDCSQLVRANSLFNQCEFENPIYTSPNPQMIGGYVGKYQHYHADATHWSIGSNCTIAAVDPNQYYYVSFSVDWSWIKCYRNAGQMYYTENMVPTAVVCTHAEPTWQQGN